MVSTAMKKFLRFASGFSMRVVLKSFTGALSASIVSKAISLSEWNN
jgi:hypothetical protein